MKRERERERARERETQRRERDGTNESGSRRGQTAQAKERKGVHAHETD